MAHFFGSTLLKVLRSCHKLSVCPLSFSSKGSILNVDGSFCANGGYARFLSRPASEHRVITMGNGIPVTRNFCSSHRLPPRSAIRGWIVGNPSLISLRA